MKKVVVVGSGFGGISIVQTLCGNKDLEITLIDERNYHLFPPLLYQVATAALSPADISIPIRAVFARCPNVFVVQARVTGVDMDARRVKTAECEFAYDYLFLACGAKHVYFGHNEWEQNAPGLKTLEQAVQIRERILMAFEKAEVAPDEASKNKHMTFVIVGGGPTGVELAGAISEVGHLVLSRDFRHIDPQKTRVILVEALPRILSSFSETMSVQASKDLRELKVEVRTCTTVTSVDAEGVCISQSGGNGPVCAERISSATVLWAAGISATQLDRPLGVGSDRQGRVCVEADLSVKGRPEVFVVGDQASCIDPRTQKPLPAVATVAMQQGRRAALNVLQELKGKPRQAFTYFDKGQAATIGKNRAIVELGVVKLSGFIAWVIWLFIHLWFLMGFNNRVLVLLKWTWAYFGHHHGSRIILAKDWRFFPRS